jgi:hypothetical protein
MTIEQRDDGWYVEGRVLTRGSIIEIEEPNGGWRRHVLTEEDLISGEEVRVVVPGQRAPILEGFVSSLAASRTRIRLA